ncbi:cytochrome c55X [Colwellia chukchiensis]|uniref:Cytochrome c55X n=1 Tax=Colwellia chukchiensis TaxID=641665 RepID=A0A1H7M0T4_9GAMM|nr:cytochrome c [Colwellia chukchiensis]SEL04833.1 cytochrome c55X [Colwellia chukchiensis]
MKVIRGGLTVFVSIASILLCSVKVTAAELTADREAQLVHLLKQDCGSCHGMSLKGGLGPPLLASDMHKLPVDVIKNTILFGRPGTAMPPWQNMLTEQEALWLSKQLQQGVKTHD